MGIKAERKGERLQWWVRFTPRVRSNTYQHTGSSTWQLSENLWSWDRRCHCPRACAPCQAVGSPIAPAKRERSKIVLPVY